MSTTVLDRRTLLATPALVAGPLFLATAAVRDADEANSDHMAEEEREDLVDFRRHADLQTRHEIAVQFIVYENQHASRGITPRDQDPEEYVAENS